MTKAIDDHLKTWSKFAKTYDPIKCASIDGTDTEPHDRAVVRALNATYKPNRFVKGRPECTIFVSRLNHETSKDTIKDIFSKYGKLKRFRMVKDIVTGMPKGYAFVEYEDEESAEEAYRLANRMVVDGNFIFVDFECERLLKGWKPRRLGGGFGGKKESGQLRFGGRDRPFKKPIALEILEQEEKRQRDRQRRTKEDERRRRDKSRDRYKRKSPLRQNGVSSPSRDRKKHTSPLRSINRHSLDSKDGRQIGSPQQKESRQNSQSKDEYEPHREDRDGEKITQVTKEDPVPIDDNNTKQQETIGEEDKSLKIENHHTKESCESLSPTRQNGRPPSPIGIPQHNSPVRNGSRRQMRPKHSSERNNLRGDRSRSPLHGGIDHKWKRASPLHRRESYSQDNENRRRSPGREKRYSQGRNRRISPSRGSRHSPLNRLHSPTHGNNLGESEGRYRSSPIKRKYSPGRVSSHHSSREVVDRGNDNFNTRDFRNHREDTHSRNSPSANYHRRDHRSKSPRSEGGRHSPSHQDYYSSQHQELHDYTQKERRISPNDEFRSYSPQNVDFRHPPPPYVSMSYQSNISSHSRDFAPPRDRERHMTQNDYHYQPTNDFYHSRNDHPSSRDFNHQQDYAPLREEHNHYESRVDKEPYHKNDNNYSTRRGNLPHFREQSGRGGRIDKYPTKRGGPQGQRGGFRRY